MAILASDSGGGSDFKPVPQGTHLAICNMVIDLGKQRVGFNGEEKVQHKVFIRWELPNERMEWTDREGNKRNGPMSIGRSYTLSLHEKAALRGDLEAWRGRAFTKDELVGFDVSKLLGVPCMVVVTHKDANGKTYANVTGIGGVPKGMPKPDKAENPLILYDDENSKTYDDLPDWLKKKIDEQVRDQPRQAPKDDGFGELDDDVPF